MKAFAALLALLLALAWLPASAQQREPQPGKDGTPATGGDSGKPRLRPGIGISISISPALLFPRRAAAEDDSAFEAGQLLVLWPEPALAEAGPARLAALGLQPVQTVELSALGSALVLLQFPDMAQARAWRERLRREQPDWVTDLNAQATPMQAAAEPAPAPRLYAQRMLGIAGRAAAGGARLGVIDGPIDPALLTPDQATRWLAGGPQVHTLPGMADAGAPTAHGSAVALLIGAAPLSNGFAGSGPAQALLWVVALRQQGEQLSTNTFLLAQAFDWLLKQQVQLVNVSLGGAGDDVLRRLVERLLARGVALLAAAGNKPDSSAVFPAAYPGVWAVTAVDAQGRPWARASRGKHVVVAAPGVDLWVPDASTLGSAAPSGRYVSGSSFATALASAVVARAPAPFWQAPPAERQQRLCSSAGPAGSATTVPTGCGLLRLDDAVAAAWAGQR